jgi:putative transposase
MTRSAKGTLEKPGKMVAQKAGLNREILDTAPGLLTQQLHGKAAEAGCVFVEVNTRRLKPSQTCPKCGTQKKKDLSERQHRCGCGFAATRDQAAALVILKHALDDYGRKPTGGNAPENSTQSGEAVWVE